MKFPVLDIVVSLIISFPVVFGDVTTTQTPRPRGLLRPPPPLSNKAVAPSFTADLAASAVTNGTAFFQQLIDHNQPELGTFSQKFFWNSEFWAGPGSPVVLFTPGEVAAAPYIGYLTNETIVGTYAQEIRGAAIVLEHRYWGDSSPFDTLTVENLQHLTLQNSIADLTHFAKTVSLPFDPKNTSQASKAPWVLSGGSYSGALAAWTESTAPGTFWAYHASSAPVEAVFDYWEYFAPVQEGMAQNCSSDVSLVIDHVDDVLMNGSQEEKQALKDMFGLGGIEADSDFASALQNGPWMWQENAFYTGYSEFFEWCDFVEGVAGEAHPVNPGPEGVGLEKALAGYAKWMNTTLLPFYCAGYGYWTDEFDLSCFNSFNASSPIFTDLTVGNSADRQWQWFLCNQPFAYWQDGAPQGRPTIVSRLVNAEYWQRQCALFFPPEGSFTFGSARGETVDDVNAFTKGWEITDSTRLIWTNGQFDPWRESGVSSEFRPGGPLASTAQAPLQVIPGGFHCSDLIIENGQVNAGAQKVIDNEVAQIVKWVSEFYETQPPPRV